VYYVDVRKKKLANAGEGVVYLKPWRVKKVSASGKTVTAKQIYGKHTGEYN
jgi:hypothetical protein